MDKRYNHKRTPNHKTFGGKHRRNKLHDIFGYDTKTQATKEKLDKCGLNQK